MVILNILINPYFDLCQLFGSHALKMREVETQTLGIYQRAFLRYMVSPEKVAVVSGVPFMRILTR